MVKGGYQIIDFGSKNHTTNVGMVHEGIYDKIEGTRKAILVSGLVFSGTEYHDMFVNFFVNGAEYWGKIKTLNSTITIRVNSNDVVTIEAEVEPG